MINPRALKLFHLIADKGSLAAAADEFHLSPPAASRLISLLETEVGFELFSRDGRNLSLSERGIRFLQESRPILDSFESIGKLAADIRANQDVNLRVLSTAPCAAAWIAPALCLLKSKHVKLIAKVEVVDWLQLQSNLGSTAHDIAIASLPVGRSVFSVETTPLCRFRNLVVCHPSLPLASKDSVTAEDLAGEKIIALYKGQLARERMEEFFKASAAEFAPEVETSSSIVSLALCRQALGVTMVPSMYLEGELANGLVGLPVSPERWITFGALTPRSRPHSAVQKDFLQCLLEVAGAWNGVELVD